MCESDDEVSADPYHRMSLQAGPAVLRRFSVWAPTLHLQDISFHSPFQGVTLTVQEGQTFWRKQVSQSGFLAWHTLLPCQISQWWAADQSFSGMAL